jgi:multidrug resistance efflux pump
VTPLAPVRAGIRADPRSSFTSTRPGSAAGADEPAWDRPVVRPAGARSPAEAASDPLEVIPAREKLDVPDHRERRRDGRRRGDPFDAGGGVPRGRLRDRASNAAPWWPVALGAALLALALLIAWHTAVDSVAPYSRRGAVAGYVTPLAPRVAGQVTEVFVKEGDIVQAGAPLAQLDLRPFDLAIRQAEAQLAAALPSDRGAGSAIVAAQEAASTARNDFVTIQISTSRTLELHQRGRVTDAQAEAARAAQRAAGAKLAQAHAELLRAMSVAGWDGGLGPAVRAAQLQLERALLDRLSATFTAPVPGMVTNLRLAIGQHATPGSPALTLVDTRGAWVTAELGESQLGDVQPKDEADVIFDALPGRVYRGYVRSIGWGADSGASGQRSPQGAEPGDSVPVHVELEGGVDGWPERARIGGRAAVVVYAQGRGGAVAWMALQWLRARVWMSQVL